MILRWPWWRRCGEPSSEARQVLWQMQRLAADVDRRDDAAKCVADKLRDTRARNNFKEAVIKTIRLPGRDNV